MIRGAAEGRSEDREEFARRYLPVVRAYLASLDDPLLHQVYEKRYVEGMSQVRTAEQLALSRQRVRTLEDRRRRRLRRALKRCGIGR